MPASFRDLRPLVRVALPVAVAAILVCLAAVNIALITRWHEADDGILWRTTDGDVVAEAISPGGAGALVGVQPGDVLITIDGAEVRGQADVTKALHGSAEGATLTYRLLRGSTQQDLAVTLRPLPTVNRDVYYPLAVVGLLSIVLGASVRLRRPTDPATLHFFWLAMSFGGMFAFRYSGRLDHLDYFFLWANEVSHLALPPLFLHFALVFPDRPNPWIRTKAGRVAVYAAYVPTVFLAGFRIVRMAHGIIGSAAVREIVRLNALDLIYLSLCLLGGLALMIRVRQRVRSTTSRRQLRWIVWGLAVGTIPFVVLYVVPFVFGHVPSGAEYTAPLLVCIPLAFASAIARYRLMDVEVIVKWTLMMAAVVVALMVVFFGTTWIVEYIFGTDNPTDSERVAFLATLLVVVVYPWLRNRIQAALDRLYYRDRYDYRRALVSFARDLNSDLDLDRLSNRLVTRIRDTLAVDHIALFSPHSDRDRDFVVVASSGLADGVRPVIGRDSALGSRLTDGQTVVIDDPLPVRRLGGEEAVRWRDTGLLSFVPCVSKDSTIAVIALGRKARSEPLSSEDMALLGAVAGQAATALENARLYGQLRVKADEIERLRQFSDSVVESLSDGLLVVDLDDRVVRWNRRLEQLFGLDRTHATGRRLATFFDKPFLDSLYAARRETPEGATLYRVPLTPLPAESKRTLLVNVGIAPLRTPDGTHAGSIIMLEDVTDRANLEEQLRLSEKMAAIGLLAAGVAHEVNTPLTGISSFTQMLLERADPADPDTQLLEKIERQTFRAAKIISSLLNLARPSDGDAGPVDLNAVVGDVLSLLEHQLRASRIQVRKELAAPTVVVRGVEYKLQQVFLNLFLNARDAMGKGGWLSVTTTRDERGAIVEISDTGAGIPTEHIARIYDPFFTTKPEGRGTGLGLSVSYGIVQEHGGTLACESALGQGTTFTLVLPIDTTANSGAAAH